MEIRNLQRKEKTDRRLIEEAAVKALEAAGASRKKVSFAIVGPRTMARLNRNYKGRKGQTDVLAFPLGEDDYLGEVVISAEACRRQAEERKVAFETELAALVIHGVLHLAGFDHTTGPEAGRKMRRMEKEVLKALEGHK